MIFFSIRFDVCIRIPSVWSGRQRAGSISGIVFGFLSETMYIYSPPHIPPVSHARPASPAFSFSFASPSPFVFQAAAHSFSQLREGRRAGGGLDGRDRRFSARVARDGAGGGLAYA